MPRTDAPTRADNLDRLISSTGTGSPVAFRSGQTMLQESDLSNHVMVLRSGTVKLVTTGESGSEIILGLRGAPEVIGEQAALNRTPRAASVVALTDVSALAMPADDFRTLITESPEAALALLAIISERLRESDEARVELATHTVTQRVATRLLALAPKIGTVDPDTGATTLPLSQQDLAGWVGASRESVVRTLRTLRDDGVVSTERKQIVISSLEILRERSGN